MGAAHSPRFENGWYAAVQTLLEPSTPATTGDSILRKEPAVMMAKPVSGQPTGSRRRGRRGLIQAGLVAVAVATVASLLLMALPNKQVAGESLPTYAPLAPQADAHRSQTGLALDAPFDVQFNKPMNETSVESALTVKPDSKVRLQWDASSQVMSIYPVGHWDPYTNYTVDITADATDQEGLSLGTEIHTAFQSGSPTAGVITATLMVNGQAGPNTSFQLTFDRPVKLSTVMTRLSIKPSVDVAIVGDDPTDDASQVFTMTPKAALSGDTDFAVSLADGGTDSAGATLQHVDTLAITTMLAPAVVKWRPQGGSYTTDPNQNVSVRFSTAMDHASTQIAFSLLVNGKAVSGSFYWAEADTVLVFDPRSSFKVGNTVTARVSTAAKSSTGMHLTKTVTASFTVRGATSRVIPWTGGIASSTSPWYSSEVYYLGLMNCTRTGGWVTGRGDCSSVTHHTLPAQGRLSLDPAISNKVARPYAKYMADRKLLDHYLAGTTPHSRMCAQGYCGGSWGENIASPAGYGQSGMIAVEIFYQNEYWCRCEHYFNIMDPYFRRAGIGVWYASSTHATRVVIDFYG